MFMDRLCEKCWPRVALFSLTSRSTSRVKRKVGEHIVRLFDIRKYFRSIAEFKNQNLTFLNSDLPLSELKTTYSTTLT